MNAPPTLVKPPRCAWPLLLSLAGPILPPDPAKVLPQLAVPPPPKVTSAMSTEEAAHLLGQAYRNAVTHVLGERCWLFNPTHDIRNSMHFDALKAASTKLHELFIPPGSWAGWSCTVWKRYGNPRIWPPVPWVYSTSRMTEKEDWYHDEWGAGTRLLVLPAARRFRDDWLKMRAELVRSPADYDTILEVVTRYFPGDSFRERAQAISEEIGREQRFILQRVKDGDWLW